MDSAVLERFRLPAPYAHHDVIAKGPQDERAGRINSVGPSLVSRVNKFRASLRPKEVHNFDLDDVMQELWLELMVKDHYFDAARSKYITFATMIASNKLAEIRNRWHTVSGPRDTASRLRASDSADPTAIERVRQTVRETGSLAAEPADLLDRSLSPEDEAGVAEHRERIRALMVETLRQVGETDWRMAYVIRHSFGLGGSEELQVGQIAARLTMPIPDVLAIRRKAEEVIRRIVGREERLTVGCGAAGVKL